MKNRLIILLILSFGLAISRPTNAGKAASLASASEIISAINNYRVQNGLPAYSTNSILMSTAQGQSDYQASISTVTHSGPGGSRPIDRAYAAGYGDGQVVFVSEIIYGGNNAKVSDAITWWKGSPIHNDSMLSPYSKEIGAGVATDGTWVYYTAVMGYVAGGEAPPDAGSGAPSGAIIAPVIISTPKANGEIVHVVQSGQILINIAVAYGVTLDEIYRLNDLNQYSYIFPGDEILIKEAALVEATPTASPSNTPTLEIPTPTPQISATPTEALDPLSGASGLTELPASGQDGDGSPAESMQLFVTIVVGAIFVIFAGSFLLPGKREIQEEGP